MADAEELIGVFPLGLVLLPGEAVPLHLFEPRYRQLFADCVLEQRPFAIARLVGEQIQRVACTATFETVLRRHADGRLDVIVRGGSPVGVLAPGGGERLYDTALVRVLQDEDAEPAQDLVDRAIAVFERMAAGGGLPETPAGTPLSYRLAGAIDMPLDDKQALLESRSEHERLTRLVELLEVAERGTAHEQLAADRARGNGKVSPPSR